MMATSDDRSLLGTISPLLNSKGFRVSYGWGVLVSEHLTEDQLRHKAVPLSRF